MKTRFLRCKLSRGVNVVIKSVVLNQLRLSRENKTRFSWKKTEQAIVSEIKGLMNTINNECFDSINYCNSSVCIITIKTSKTYNSIKVLSRQQIDNREKLLDGNSYPQLYVFVYTGKNITEFIRNTKSETKQSFINRKMYSPDVICINKDDVGNVTCQTFGEIMSNVCCTGYGSSALHSILQNKFEKEIAENLTLDDKDKKSILEKTWYAASFSDEYLELKGFGLDSIKKMLLSKKKKEQQIGICAQRSMLKTLIEYTKEPIKQNE